MIVKILEQADSGMQVEAICRQNGISSATLSVYLWATSVQQVLRPSVGINICAGTGETNGVAAQHAHRPRAAETLP